MSRKSCEQGCILVCGYQILQLNWDWHYGVPSVDSETRVWEDLISEELVFTSEVMQQSLPIRSRSFRYFRTRHKHFITEDDSTIEKWATFWMNLSILRFEVFTAVTMKNAFSLNIKTQFVPHTRHITSLQQSPAS
jgi:hypothetical protein